MRGGLVPHRVALVADGVLRTSGPVPAGGPEGTGPLRRARARPAGAGCHRPGHRTCQYGALHRPTGQRICPGPCCSCSLCVFAARADVLLSTGRRPRLADLYAEVEQARGDSFRAGWRITDLIRHAAQCGVPALASSVRTTARRSPPSKSRCGRPCRGSPPGSRTWHAVTGACRAMAVPRQRGAQDGGG